MVIGGGGGSLPPRREVLTGWRRRAPATRPAGAGRRRGGCWAGRRLLVVARELTQLGRRLRVETRELLAVRAHARPEIAAWVADEALRHCRVPLGFGGVTVCESPEVSSQARAVARLCPLDELLDFNR